MQDHVDGQTRQLTRVLRDGRTHSAFDAVAVVRLAHDLADGQADARAAGSLGLDFVWMETAGGHRIAPGAKKSHLARMLLSRRVVGTLVISVLAQPQSGERRLACGGMF